MPESFDPVDVLRTHVRAVALLERPRDDPDDLIERITSTEPPAVVGQPLRPPRRRRWWVAGAATAVVVVGGAGVAAMIGTRPDEQILDVVCRAGADPSGSGLAVVAGDDPVGACAELWRSGAMSEQAGAADTGGVVPRLVACTGTDRPIEVYPLADGRTCADLGLVDADVTANVGDPVVELRAFVLERMSGEDCTSTRDAVRIAEEGLDLFALSHWKLSVIDRTAACALISVDDRLTTVFVVPSPTTDPLTLTPEEP